MKILKLMLLAVATVFVTEGSFAQTTAKKNNTTNKKQVSTYDTTEETIARINRMMNAEVEESTEVAATPKKRIVVEGTVKTTSTPAKLPSTNTSSRANNYSYLTEQLINVAHDYQGVKYAWGGMSRKGMDCSGFVKTAFSQFNIDLPRTSREMAALGTKISKSEAKPGDLIFFKNGGSKVINHVGIVIEVKGDEIIFIHSASSKGVSVNSTKEAYYSKGFVQVNRVYDQQIL